RPDVDADVLAFLGQAVYAADALAVTATDEEVHTLVRTAGGGVVLGDRPQRGELQAGLFLGFAAGHLLGLLVLVDQPSDQFQQPGVGAFLHGADAELFDQHHGVALRVVGQHADRIVAHEQLAAQARAHAAVELTVTQVQTVEAIEAAKAGLTLDDLDIRLAEAVAHAGFLS